MLMIPDPGTTSLTTCTVDDPPLAQAWARARNDGSRVLDGLAPGAVLRHVPGRRATVAARSHGEPVVVKVFTSPRARGNARRLDLLATSGVADVVPAPLGVSRDGQVGVLAYRPGTVMDETDDATFVASARATGVALRRLHSCGAELDRRWTHVDEVAQLVRRAPESCAGVAAEVAARPVDPAERLVPSHRDLHPRQVVVDGPLVAFIDLDDCALAPPALDIGNMVAHLRREAVVGRRSTPVAAAAVAAFLSGVGDPPADLATWVELALARLAGLAESRHRSLPERDALLAELADPPEATAPGGASDPAPADTSRVLPTGHADRPVRVHQRGGSTVVVKTYLRADGAGVHEAMTSLWASRLGRGRTGGPGMPQPLGFDSRAGELTMAWVSGQPLGARGDVGGAVTRAEEVGSLLADLHASDVVVARVRDRRALARSTARKVADVRADPSTPADVLDAFTKAGRAVDRAWAQDRTTRLYVLCHGDMSPRNVLVGDGGLVLIDFDRLQMAEPERDLAYWAAWMWVTSGARGLPDTATLLGDLVQGYATTARRVPVDRAALEVHLAVGLVRIAHGWTALRRDDDTRLRVLGQALALADRHASRPSGDPCASGSGETGRCFPSLLHGARLVEDE